MKIVLTVWFYIFFTNFNVSYGQNFDYQKEFKVILDESKNKSSQFYYQNLLDRFNKNDSTLTNREMIALQIGFTNNINYKPYEIVNKEREILRLIVDKKYDEAILKSDDLLNTNPLNLTALMEKGFAYMKLDKKDVLFHKEKTKKIIRSIFWSGNGTIERPYFVLSPLDGQTLIKYIIGGSIESMGSGRDSNNNFVDILEMKKDEKNETLYFIIEHATKKMMDRLKNTQE